MTAFTEQYVNLLIKQYWDQPNARAEIEAQAATWETIRDGLLAFGPAFDLDTAVGAQLDIVGKIAGLPRDRIEFTLDDDYRFFIRIKIAQNTGSAFMVSDDRSSIQDVIQFAFDGLAYVLDRKDMTLVMYIEDTFSISRLLTLIDLKLLPKPQGVRYLIIMYATADLPFGFSELTLPAPTDVAGYGELVFAPTTGGIYSELFGA